MRGRIKLALTSGTVLAATAAAYLMVGHHAVPVQAVPVALAAPVPAPPAAAVPPPIKPAHHPLRAVMSTLGLASWYGAGWDGRRTASGETFDKDLLTACHRTLPFGTMVRVVSVATGRSVVVRINDRGTMTPGRIIDLSSGAANELGILNAGVARVRLEVLQKVEDVARAQRPL